MAHGSTGRSETELAGGGSASRAVESDARRRVSADGAAALSLLLERAGRLRERMAVALARIELTDAEYRTLARVRDAGAPFTGTAAGRSSAPEVLDGLTSKGLVRRESARGSDGLRLTELGSARVAEGARALAAIAGQFVAALDPAERAELDRVLGVLRARRTGW